MFYVAIVSCEKECSICQSKDFSESGESKYVSKPHGECNVTHFSGSNVKNQQHCCKESYSEGNGLHYKRNGTMTTSRIGFIAQKKR